MTAQNQALSSSGLIEHQHQHSHSTVLGACACVEMPLVTRYNI